MEAFITRKGCGSAALTALLLAALCLPVVGSVSSSETPGETESWTVSGDGSRTIDPPGFIQDGRKPLAARLEEPGADNYILVGEVLFPQPRSSLNLAIGEVDANGKLDDQPTVRVQLNSAGKLVWGRRVLRDESLKTANTWLRFSAQLFHGEVESQLHLPGVNPVRAQTSPGPQGVTLTLQRLPRYAEFQFVKPPVLTGERPWAIQLRVRGNGGWGRIMFELTDAAGNTWTSVRGGTMGEPFVNFDGWQTMRFPLPGNYPYPNDKLRWPGSDDWQGLVDATAQPATSIVYPLKLNKLIVAMRPEILYVAGRASPEPVIYLERLVVLPPPEGM